MLSVHLILLIIAVILFVVAALEIPSSRINLVAAGLACFAASFIF